MSNASVCAFSGALLQAGTPGGTATAPSYDPEVVGSLLQNMVLVILVLLFVMVVAVILLRTRHQEFMRTRKARRPKPTQLEDIWFENPIERRGEKPASTRKKDGETRGES